VKKNILWIEDDYYSIKGLVRPLEMDGFEIDVATSAFEGYTKCQNWKDYDLIMVDMDLPLSDGVNEKIPEEIQSWEKEELIGINLSKWIAVRLQAKIPILILSIVNDPIKVYNLEKYGLKYCIDKSGLLPSKLKDEVMLILKGSSR
jgi:CheY-like chemotaxis protein